jgi:hypothetical protein
VIIKNKNVFDASIKLAISAMRLTWQFFLHKLILQTFDHAVCMGCLVHQTRVNCSKIDSHVGIIAILSHDARIVAFLSSATLQVGSFICSYVYLVRAERDCFCCLLSFMSTSGKIIFCK